MSMRVYHDRPVLSIGDRENSLRNAPQGITVLQLGFAGETGHIRNELGAAVDAHQTGVQRQVVVLAHTPVVAGVVLVIRAAALVFLLKR